MGMQRRLQQTRRRRKITMMVMGLMSRWLTQRRQMLYPVTRLQSRSRVLTLKTATMGRTQDNKTVVTGGIRTNFALCIRVGV